LFPCLQFFYIELAVDLRRNVKDAFVQYRMICQQAQTGSMEKASSQTQQTAHTTGRSIAPGCNDRCYFVPAKAADQLGLVGGNAPWAVSLRHSHECKKGDKFAQFLLPKPVEETPQNGSQLRRADDVKPG